MAHQHSVVFIDDIDGSEAAQTVAFSLDGQHYEIDLGTRNIQRLHDVLAPFTSKARKVGGEPGASRRGRKPIVVHAAQPPARIAPLPATPPPATPPPATTPPATTPPATPPAATPPADTGRRGDAGGEAEQGGDPAPDSGAVEPSRRSVPAAVFSDSAEYVAPRQQTPPKPHTTALFSPAG